MTQQRAVNWNQSPAGGYVGTDKDGNKYSMPAHRETVTCRTRDGFEGYGWTAEEALSLALKNRQAVIDQHNAALEEMKANSTEKALYETATRVLNRADDITQEEIKIAGDAELVIWPVDVDGYYPSPTERYIELMDKYDPVTWDEEPDAETALPLPEKPEPISWRLWIDGQSVGAPTDYDDGLRWLIVVRNHFGLTSQVELRPAEFNPYVVCVK